MSEPKTQPATTTEEPALTKENIETIFGQVAAGTLVGKAAIDSLIDIERSLWKEGRDNRLTMGQGFSLMRESCGLYGKDPHSGLAYPESVARTGVPRSTAELHRNMYEVHRDHEIPQDSFLVLCENGVNLGSIKPSMGLQWAEFVKVWAPEIKNLDITNGDAVEELADKLKKAARPKGTKPKTLAQLEANLQEQKSALMDRAKKAANPNEVLSLSAEAQQTEKEINETCIAGMRSLVSAVAPALGWSIDKTRSFMKSFEAQTPAEQRQRYKEALALFEKMMSIFSSTTKAA